MGFVTGDRVLETTTTTGNGSLTLAGAVSGYRAFSAVATNNGDTFYYAIALGADWEVGLGTRVSTGPFVLARTTVIASSTGVAVVFPAGTKEVWMDIPARLIQEFLPSINHAFINGSIVESHAGNAATFAIKTLAGADPSAADPVFFVFGDVAGSTYVRVVTAALSITVASGATMGAPSAKGFRIWLSALDNAGTVELAVRNCADQTTGNIAFFASGGENRISTTVQAGAADDLALVSYSVAARTNVPHIVLGNYSYTSLATAGTWASSPATINLFSRQMPRPGEVIQTRRASFNTTTLGGAGSYVDSTVLIAITPSSVANAIRVTTFGGGINFGASAVGDMRLRNTTQGVTVGQDPQFEVTNNTAVVLYTPAAAMSGVDFPSSVSAQTYNAQIKAVAGATNYTSGATNIPYATIIAEEIMT